MLLFLAACSQTGVLTRDFLIGDTAVEGVLDADDVEQIDGGFRIRCDHTELAVTALDDGIVRLRYGEPRASWAVVGEGTLSSTPSVVIYSDVVALRTAAMTVLVAPETCRVTVLDPDDQPLVEEPEEGGFGGVHPSLTRLLADGERIYGLGERTGAFERRGGRYTCRNTDAFDAEHGGWAPDADPLYQCVPFYVSVRDGVATGVFSDVSYTSEWDVGASASDRLETRWDVGYALDQYVIAGPSFAKVLDRYTTLTGRPPLPPRWALGFHQSRWGWSPDDAVTDVVDGFRARDLPLDAVWLDIQHMDGFRSWTWDPATFPDPEGLVADLAADGVRVVSIVDPAIKVDPDWDVYVQGVEQGYFLEVGDTPWVGEVWPGDAVFPDFTNPAVRAWWGGLAIDDLERGIAGFWLDMNEPAEFTQGTVPDTLGVHGDGAAGTMSVAHNVYGLLEARATYEGWRAHDPDRRPFLLTRAGYAGIQRYAAAWTGDAPSTWDALATTLPMLLGMSVSGESWVGSDVGGYSGGATPELYTRWMQLGAFSPFFRAHLVQGAADQYPWSFGQEVLDISRGVLDLRRSLLPYLYSLAWEASRTGAPPLRPLVWEWPADPDVRGDQALFGPWLLVAPVLEEGTTTREVYLPEGRWFDFYTGVVHDGPATVTLTDLPLAALPLFVREGAIVPRTTDAESADVTLEVWPGAAASRFTVYEDAGDGPADTPYAATTWTLQGHAGGARLASTREGTYALDRTVRVRVRRVDHAPTAVRLDGAALPEVEGPDGTGWWWDPVDLSLWVAFPDASSVTLELDYDPDLTEPAPPVAMPFRVTLPDGTPDGPVYIATSADGWATHTPLTRVSATEASGTIEVPRGQFLYYKYTRGGWDTVEKWPACEEASNRYELGRAQRKDDVVYGWRDWCPE